VHRLLLLRHAKSSWADPGIRDHDRPLNDRGRRAAIAMGEHLRAQGWIPDVTLCSSARRTCETAALLDLPRSAELVVEHDLYLADPDTVLHRIRAVDDRATTVMVIGHNPTMHEVASDVVLTGDADAIRRLGEKYPTGALAVVDVDIDGGWRALARGTGHLSAFVTPRSLVAD
jgi:phosphohistidine phosphatase